MTESTIFWTLNPADERTHAVTLGDPEALCGVVLPPGEARLNWPWGMLCVPCAIGATADLPDPGSVGS